MGGFIPVEIVIDPAQKRGELRQAFCSFLQQHRSPDP